MLKGSWMAVNLRPVKPREWRLPLPGTPITICDHRENPLRLAKDTFRQRHKAAVKSWIKYLTSVREIEQRIERTQRMPVTNPVVDAPSGIPASYDETQSRRLRSCSHLTVRALVLNPRSG